MNYLNSLKYNGFNKYGCGTIAIHNALVWANESLVPSLDKNLDKISKMIKEKNQVSSVKHVSQALKRLKKQIDTETLEEINMKEIKNHLKNEGSMILLSFDENSKIGHYEFYRYKGGLVYQSDTLSSFREIAKKINTKNKFGLTPEAWLVF
jgi:hypothetical protein